MGKKVSAFRDPATRIDDDDRRSAAPVAAWHTEEEEKNSTAAVIYEQRLIIIRVNYAILLPSPSNQDIQTQQLKLSTESMVVPSSV